MTRNFLFGLALCIGLIASTNVLAKTYRDVRSNKTIRVKGFAEDKITSDTAIWRASVSTQGADLKTAYNKLQTDQELVLEFLSKNGIPRETVGISPVSKMPKYKINDKGYATNEQIGWELSKNYAIESKNVYLVNNIAKNISSLLSKGVSISSFSPEYYFSKLDGLKIDLLAKATANAKERAKALAENSESRVGHLISASQGVFQITRPNSTNVSNYGSYDTSTINKAVKAVVTVRYGVD